MTPSIKRIGLYPLHEKLLHTMTFVPETLEFFGSTMLLSMNQGFCIRNKNYSRKQVKDNLRMKLEFVIENNISV